MILVIFDCYSSPKAVDTGPGYLPSVSMMRQLCDVVNQVIEIPRSLTFGRGCNVTRSSGFFCRRLPNRGSTIAMRNPTASPCAGPTRKSSAPISLIAPNNAAVASWGMCYERSRAWLMVEMINLIEGSLMSHCDASMFERGLFLQPQRLNLTPASPSTNSAPNAIEGVYAPAASLPSRTLKVAVTADSAVRL